MIEGHVREASGTSFPSQCHLSRLATPPLAFARQDLYPQCIPCKKAHLTSGPKLLIFLEAPIGIEPMNGRFAVRIFPFGMDRSVLDTSCISDTYENSPLVWSGARGAILV